LQKLDFGNAFPEGPSKGEIFQFLDTYETTQGADSAYQWLTRKSSPQQQMHKRTRKRKSAETKIVNTTPSMWEILSNLAKLAERAGFTIDTTIHNEMLVVVIGNIPDDKAASLLIQELLTIIFARLSCVESRITHSKNTTTVTISMNSG
jgi:hypothetical protein